MAAAAESPPGEVAVFVHQPTRSITLVEGSVDIESLLREIPSKEGPLPATKASIESLPRVQVSEAGLECAICLAEYEVNGGEESEVKEMPCRHRFHSGCIDKWLGIHGSCPICRFSMPAEERKESGEESGGWRIHVFLARGRGDPESDTDMDAGAGYEGEGNWEGEDDDGNGENDDSPAQAMDIDESD